MIRCPNCHSNEFTSVGDVYICSFCGCKFSKEETKALEEQTTNEIKKFKKENEDFFNNYDTIINPEEGDENIKISNLLNQVTNIIDSKLEDQGKALTGKINEVASKINERNYNVETYIKDGKIVMACNDIYNNIEDALKNKFKIKFIGPDYLIDADEYEKIFQETNSSGARPLMRFDKSTNNYVRIRPSIYKGNPKLYKMCPFVRFYKAGLCKKKAILASNYLIIVHRIRHRDTDSIKDYCKVNNLKTKEDLGELILKIYKFFVENGFYN